MDVSQKQLPQRREERKGIKKLARDIEAIAKVMVDAAIKVHRTLGPGLLESAYQKCYAHEMHLRGLKVITEVMLPIIYEGLEVDAGYRIDMAIEDMIVVENKVVEQLLPIHEAQLLTYLKLSGYSLGFLLNWNVKLMKYGIKRMVNDLPE